MEEFCRCTSRPFHYGTKTVVTLVPLSSDEYPIGDVPRGWAYQCHATTMDPTSPQKGSVNRPLEPKRGLPFAAQQPGSIFPLRLFPRSYPSCVFLWPTVHACRHSVNKCVISASVRRKN